MERGSRDLFLTPTPGGVRHRHGLPRDASATVFCGAATLQAPGLAPQSLAVAGKTRFLKKNLESPPKTATFPPLEIVGTLSQVSIR